MITRDRTCTFVGCRMPAWRCDLDHRNRFDHSRNGDGQTCEQNLHSLCRHHHQLKTYGGWHVDRDAGTGDTEWTAPTGHRYVRPSTEFNPDPPPQSRPRPSPHEPDDDGDPPF